MNQPAHQHTERLDLLDSTLRERQATVLDVDDNGIVLDRSAFYPGGGGKPSTSKFPGFESIAISQNKCRIGVVAPKSVNRPLSTNTAQ